jgi:superfamily II DNA or RNA helicase
MSNPVDLYIITTAMKRNKGEWDEELLPYRISSKPELNYYDNKVVIDSWNNIKKYVDVKGAFFIFDECHVNGYGTWTKAFLKMAKNNDWIILSATPGDDWMQYMPIFIANGFYRNKTEFINEHVVYSPYITKYPKIERYTNTGRLLRLRNEILVDMDFKRLTVQHHEDVYCSYDILKYKQIMKTRWDPYREEPITQASGLCYVLRKVVNSDETRQVALLEILEKTPKAIIFYSFDYELDILLNLGYEYGTEIAQYNGHVHEPIPTGDRWVYLVNYFGCEGWNAITTDTIIFFSQTYSYKTMIQAAGRIDRLNTPFRDLYYYHLKSRSGIDLAISKALSEKRKFNETKWVKW